MARPCTICTHPERAEIDRLLAAGEKRRNVTERFGCSPAALTRHQAHIAELVARARARQEREETAHGAALVAQQAEQEQDEQEHALDILGELAACIRRVQLISDACDAWLRDPDDPDRYSLAPRAEDVHVIFTEPAGEGKPVRKKERLSLLLRRLEKNGAVTVEAVETKHADPRELLLKAYDRLESRLTLVAKLIGELQQEGTTSIVVAGEWVRLRSVIVAALSPYPEASAAVAAALVEVEG